MRRILTKKSYVPVIEEEEAGALLDLPLESLLPRYLQSSYSSPVTFAEEEAHGQRKNKHEYQKSATSGNNSGSLLEKDSSYANYANYSNLLQVISPVESVSMFRQNSPRFMRSPGGNRESRPDDRKVWQLVLSDISLSAARLSTGSEGTSRDEFEDLKGDLTHAKVKEHPDFFAENMRQAKAKFYGHATEEGGDTKRNS
ncbi:hypothetical protein METBIDRAFT_32841 [Metschnikowia bicuspidata var. bicuspidata NRRL YB-4993]|uniref:Uncharacterized protein n=1 Tax=Metschnikowia bicuspidata var. bicuspidata NRRL YB-4993 TaxID=869754 RepID=A0A1A0H799_9ASCO|nr:hypothetical protein METBIDRAFT_32841 [Metschnikowia bicuspidata var. bicuspidata NRRL YB-4993]OBA19772.1 hypothetical protein METBIDRAFT_32841 [Metschnikowia bicuspidata var. bicuspidata NRRL YB-4993]